MGRRVQRWVLEVSLSGGVRSSTFIYLAGQLEVEGAAVLHDLPREGAEPLADHLWWFLYGWVIHRSSLDCWTSSNTRTYTGARQQTHLVLVAGALHHLVHAGEAVAQHLQEVGQVRELARAVVPRDEAPARLLGCRAMGGLRSVRFVLPDQRDKTQNNTKTHPARRARAARPSRRRYGCARRS